MTGLQKRILRDNVNQWVTRMFAVGAGPVLMIGTNSPTLVTEVTVVGDDGLKDVETLALLVECADAVRRGMHLRGERIPPHLEGGAK